MPRGDRTGPDGMGPMTGRALGFCAGYDRPGYAASPYGAGYGRGRGFGRGFGRGYGYRYNAGGAPPRRPYGGWTPAPYPAAPVQYSPEEELEFRRREVEMMEADLKAAREHIAKLEKEKE